MDNVVTAGASQAMALPRVTGSDEVHRPDDDLGGIGAGGAGSRLGRMLVCPSMSAGKPKLDMGLASLVDVELQSSFLLAESLLAERASV